MRTYVWLGCTALIVVLMAVFWPVSPPPEAPTPVSDTPARYSATLPTPSGTTSADKAQAHAHAVSTLSSDYQDLWPENQWSSEPSEEGFPLYRNQADVSRVQRLDKGMVITIPLPNRAGSVEAHITEKKAGFGGIPVLTGFIGDDPEGVESVTVVQGKFDTHMTIITRQATWTAVIDNQTGKTVVVDERDRMKTQVLDARSEERRVGKEW